MLTNQRNPPGLTLGILLSQKTANDYCSKGIESVTEFNARPNLFLKAVILLVCPVCLKNVTLPYMLSVYVCCALRC